VEALLTPTEEEDRGRRPRDLGARLAARLTTLPSGRWWFRGLAGEGQLIASLVGLSFLVYALAGRLRVVNGFPSGDEPSYLVLTQAMQLYHSLDVSLVHANGDYRVFYNADLDPHVVPGADGQMRTLHQIGGPLLWVVPFALGGRQGVLGFMAIVSVLTVLNIYYFLRERGITAPYAFVTSAGVAVGSPIYVYSSMSFVEPIGALGAIYAVRVIFMQRAHPFRLVLAATATAYIPWVHMRFAPLALSLGLLLLWRVWRDYGRTKIWPYVQVLGPLVASVVLIEVYTILLYGEIDPMAPQAIYGVKVFDVPLWEGFAGTLFDRNYGLITNFPLFFLVLPGLLLALDRRLRETSLILLAVAVPYTALSVTSTTWWGSYNPPARYPEVLVPVFAFFIAVVLQRINLWIVNAGAVLLAVAAYALHLATDLVPNDRFTGWDLRHMGMARLGNLIHVNFQQLAPSSFLPGQLTRFVAWIAAAALIGVGLWWLGRWRGGEIDVPVEAVTPRAETAGVGGGQSPRSWRRLPRPVRVGIAVGLVGALGAGTVAVAGGDRNALDTAEIIGIWYSPDGGQFEFLEDGTFSAAGLRDDVLTYAPLTSPAEHSGEIRKDATGEWQLLTATQEVELRFSTLDGGPADLVKKLSTRDWFEEHVLYFLIAYPDSNLWYGFFREDDD
jgi:hypothetical protein